MLAPAVVLSCDLLPEREVVPFGVLSLELLQFQVERTVRVLIIALPALAHLAYAGISVTLGHRVGRVREIAVQVRAHDPLLLQGTVHIVVD